MPSSQFLQACWPTCFGDIDSVFAYQVPVQAVVKDARLGLLHYTLMLFIFVYVVIFQVWRENGFLSKPEMGMALRSSLQEPTQHCGAEFTGCKRNYTSLDKLPYCCPVGEKECPDNGADVERRPCSFFSGPYISHFARNALSITTQREIIKQTPNPSCFNGSWVAVSNECEQPFLEEPSGILNVADIERFTIMIEPSTYSLPRLPTESGVLIPGNRMQGLLQVGPPRGSGEEPNALQRKLCAERDSAVDASYGGYPTNKAPCYIPADHVFGGNDIFRVETLLQAMGISLDDARNDSTELAASSFRASGFVATVIVDFNNFQPWVGTVASHYTIRVRLIPGSRWGQDIKRETLKFQDSGMSFVFEPSGSIAVHSFSHLLTILTTSVTLLAVAAVAVKYLAVWVFPLGNYYQASMTRETPDFDEIEALDKIELKELEKYHAAQYRHVPADKSKIVLGLLEAGYSALPTDTSDSVRSHKSRTLIGDPAASAN